MPIDINIRNNYTTPVNLGSARSLGAYGLRFSTMLPGGCGECTFNLPVSSFSAEDYLVPPSIWSYNNRVNLLDGGEMFWSGRMEDLELHKGTDGIYWTIRALGFGVNLMDQIYTTQDVRNVATGTVITNAVTSLAPQITAYSVSASGFTLSNVAAITLNTISAGAVVAWASRYGDSAFNPAQWYVYPDSDGTIRFTWEDRPTTAGIRALLADFHEADFALYGKNLYNRIVSHTSGGSHVTRNNTTLQGGGELGGWNVIKTFVAVLPETAQAADHQQLGDALLTQFGTPRIAATSLRTQKAADQLTMVDTYGRQVNPFRIRAGQLMQFMDMPTSAGLSNGIQWANTFVVAGTDYDEDSQTLTITPEGYDNSADKLLAKVDYLLRGRLGLVSA